MASFGPPAIAELLEFLGSLARAYARGRLRKLQKLRSRARTRAWGAPETPETSPPARTRAR